MLPHLVKRRRVRRHVLYNVVKRDEQTDERETRARRRVVGQIDAKPNSDSATPT